VRSGPAGKGTASPVELAAELLALLVTEFPDRIVHGVGDAAYHSRALLVADTTWTTRLPSNAALYAPAPPRTGKRGRPARKGAKLGTPEQIAATTAWRRVTVTRYGWAETVEVAWIECVWYGSFANTHGRLVLVRDATWKKVYDLALFTTDVTSPIAAVVERYATRWSIEPANAAGKQQLGVGQARHRLPQAVHRTVPFGMLVQSLVIIWYAVAGHHPDDMTRRRQAEPWYDLKTEPSFDDMIIKLRKAIIAARFSGASQPRPTLRYCETTPWPAKQPPRRCETRGESREVKILPATRPKVWVAAGGNR
jgi:hypothetical protein